MMEMAREGRLLGAQGGRRRGPDVDVAVPGLQPHACALASIWVDKAKKGSTQWVDTCSDAQLQAFWLWRRCKLIVGPIKYGYLLLALVETPSWCLRANVKCASHRDDMPGSLSPLLSPLLIDILEMLCLSFFLARRTLRRHALGPAYRLVGWHAFSFVLLSLSFLDCAVACVNTIGIVPTSFRLSRLCRPFIVLAYSKSLRRVVCRIALSVPRFLDAILSLAICVVLFVWIGLLLFANGEEGVERFASWDQAFASLWVLFTTANFPDVMLPGLNERRANFLFFFVYLIVSLYLLNNVILAAVYDAYKEELTRSLRSFYERRSSAIRHAFALLADDSGEVPQCRWEAFFKAHFGGRMGRSIDPGLFEYNAWRSSAIFRVMNFDQSNGLSFVQFRMIIEAILDGKIYIPSTKPPRAATGGWAEWTRALILSGVEVRGRRVLWDIAVDVVILVNMLLLLAQTLVFVSPLAGGRFADDPLQPKQAWSYALFAFSCLYVVETSVRIAVLGFERFWHRRPYQYRFDFATVYVLFVMEVVFLASALPPWGMRLIVLLRLTRGLRIMRHVRRLESLGKLMVRLVPVYRYLGLTLLLIYYIYATVGVQVFGGLIYTKNEALDGSDYQNQGYWVLNFNDFLSGMMTLFVLMVVNNWYIIADGFLRVSGTKWAAVFFVSFFVLVNLIVLNILVTLIIECFASVRDEGFDTRSVVSEEAIEGPQAQGSCVDQPNAMRRHGYEAEHSEQALLRRLLLAESSEGMSWMAPLTHGQPSVPS